jgi:ribosomal protein S18 acetylase RimI-like enzyme
VSVPAGPETAADSVPTAARIRPALLTDLPELLRLERDFTDWQLDRRRFRYLLVKANALLLVADDSAAAPALRGYVLLLFRRNSGIARVYSLAVEPAARRQQLGRRLLAAAELAASRHGCTTMQLEVSSANAAAIKLYERAGYRVLVQLPDYYGPGLPGVRYLKSLACAHSPQQT